jgi:phospholipid-binding lipoprotein MlaA
MKRLASIFSFLAAALCLCGCSTASAQEAADNDPLEGINRPIFAFDVWVEHNVARPVDDAYRAVVPEFGRDGVHNLVSNLHAPIVLANDVLQGESGKAATTFGRLAINSTIGVGGLIDMGNKLGLPGHENDFGITLGKVGVAEGSYLVLPLVGPLPPRDLVGSGVDGFFDPLSWARFHGKDTWMFIRSGLRVLDLTDRTRDQFDSIERTSIDFYATTRNLYRQNRDAKIRGETVTANAQLPDF